MTRLDFIKKRLAAPPPQGAAAILYAGFCVAAPTVVRGVVDPVVSATTFSTYYPFVLVAGLFLSWQSAIGVAAASAIAGDYLFVEPRFTLFPTPQERFAAAIFVVSAALIIIVGNTLRRTVAELERARTHEAHLNSELQHRVRNTLAVVHALVRQTFRETPGAKAEVDKLHGRLGALAEANEILRSGHWEGCVLPELAVRALEPFNGRAAIKLVGPECRLLEESCVPLVLALHELATNAVKYGALSTGEGSVELSWTLSRTIEGQTQLRMSWVERGGPAVSAPTRRGLGSRLLQPKGGLTAVGVNFHPGGVAAAIVVDGAIAVSD